MTVFGLDMSEWQPLSLDLAAMRREGVEFIILRGGQGTRVDRAFAQRVGQARAAGMLTAAYWFLDARVSVAAQVATAVATVPRGMPIIPDVEPDGSSNPSLSMTRQFIDGVRAAGYTVPMTYLPRWYWQQLGSPDLSSLPPLWSSRYPDNTQRTLGAALDAVPVSYWTGYGGLNVAMIQMSSSASVAGYAPLDANVHPSTRDDVARLFGLGGASPAPARTDGAPIAVLEAAQQ